MTTQAKPGLARQFTILLLVAASYYITGKLGLLMAVQPGYATAVFPASGIALAGVLLLGYRVWPGILLGSFLINIPTSFDAGSALMLLKSVSLAAGIGTGASLQALAGAYLVKRYTEDTATLTQEHNIFKMLTLGGPVACLISATVGLSILGLAGIVEWINYPFTWWTWWLGDTIGVLIFTPLVLVWATGSSQVSLRTQLLVSLPLLVTFVFVVMLFIHTSAREEERIKLEFARQTDQLTQTLRKSFDGHIDALHSIESLYLSSDEVSREEFHRFVAHLLARYPGIKALSWNPQVAGSERTVYEEAARQEGYGEFQFTERNARRQLIPAGRRDGYTTVYYIEPYAGNENVLGYDTASDPVRLEALTQARISGQPVATGPSLLVQDTASQPGFIVYMPVYRNGLPVATPEQRRLNLRGYIGGAFRVDEMMNTLLQDMPREDIEIKLYDRKAGQQERLLYASHVFTAGMPPRGVSRDQLPAALQRDVSFAMAGRQWKLSFSPTQRYLDARRSWQAWSVLASGMLFTGLLGTLLLIMTGRNARTEGLVLQRTDELLRTNQDLQRNISERIQADAALREKQQFLQAVLENIEDGIVACDADGNLTLFNHATREFHGLPEMPIPPEEWAEHYDLYLADGSTRMRYDQIPLFRALRGEQVHDAEMIIAPKNLKNRTLIASGQALIDASGEKIGAVVSMHDVTEQKSAERALQESSSLQRAILDSAGYAIVTTDLNGVIRSFNRAAQTMLGYGAEELIGKASTVVFHDPAEVAQRAQQLSQELGVTITPGFDVFVCKARLMNVDEHEWTFARKDGTRFTGLLSVTALHGEQGEITGFVGIASDISERKKIERMKNEFISTVSHELRTPLTSIRGALGLVKGGVTGPVSEQAQGMIDIAYKNSERLARLIDDILDIEKIASGKMEFNLQLLPVMSIVEQAVEANRAYAQQFGVSFVIRESVPKARVLADSDRLMQIMANLLSNAAKFSPARGTVEIVASRHDAFIRVTIVNHGPGIPAEFHDRIFQRFAQADSSDTRQKGGTGLGLSIVKTIVEKMGGRVGFTSEPDVVTTFYFDLPAC